MNAPYPLFDVADSPLHYMHVHTGRRNKNLVGLSCFLFMERLTRFLSMLNGIKSNEYF